MEDQKLVEALKVVLADSFAFYLKAHNYHWNVEGPNFSEYHTFFGTLYTEVWEATDMIAEHIRTLDAYVPGSFSRFSELATIEDETKIPTSINMLKKMLTDNQKVIDSLNAAHKLADAAGNRGIVNFLEGRLDIHDKHGWMLRSFTKAGR